MLAGAAATAWPPGPRQGAGPDPARHRARRPGRPQRAAAGHRPVRQVRARPQRLPAAGAPGAPGCVEGNPDGAGGRPADAVRTGHAFLDDIAHNAVPTGDREPRDGPPIRPDPDTDAGHDRRRRPAPTTTRCSTRTSSPATAGSTRTSALTAVHHIFHSEHNRLRGRHRRPDQHAPTTGAQTLSRDWQHLDRRPAGTRRAALPGRALRHRDGVPAPGVRGVRPQGAADGQPLR